jgi:cytoskeletal protein RodZ
MSIGQTLRDARLARNLSIADVATAIRVRATIIQDIEQDSFESCGGEVYGRGHQRMYARYLGLNIENQIATLSKVEPEFETISLQATKLKPIGSRPNWSLVLATGSLVSLALLAVIFIGNNDGISEPASIITQVEDSEISEPADEAASNTELTQPGDVTAALTESVSVGISVVSDSCWLRVEDSLGAVVFQGVLRAGDERSFTDETQLSMVLGNAGGVNFTLNGVDLGTPGERGEVLRLTVTPGMTALLP